MCKITPKDWKVFKVNDILTFSTAPSKSKFREENGRYLIMDMGAISKTGKNISYKRTNLNENILDAGDLVMPKDDIGGGFIIGKTAFIDEANKYVLGDHVYLLKINKKVCDPLFVHYKFNSHAYNRKLKRLVTGSAQLGITSKNIMQEKFIAPPLKEQQKIAAILSSVDETIKKTEKIIEQTILIKNRLANQLLTIGIHHSNYKMTPIGRIPETWDFVNLSQVLTVQGGYAFKSINAVDKGIKWLKIANVGIGETKWNDKSFLPENYEDKYKAFLLKENDIVMAMTRPILNNKIKISKLSIEDTPSLLNQRVCRFIIKNNFSEDFFYHLARSRKFVNEIKLKIAGTDPPNISSKQIESIIVPMPPLEDQVKIASILNEFENKISNENDTLLYLNSLKKGLMQQLLTGKVRVPLNENEEVPQ